jgi:hypothetical protein
VTSSIAAFKWTALQGTARCHVLRVAITVHTWIILILASKWSSSWTAHLNPSSLSIREPSVCLRPESDKGIPIAREIRFFAALMPRARFNEKLSTVEAVTSAVRSVHVVKRLRQLRVFGYRYPGRHG